MLTHRYVFPGLAALALALAPLTGCSLVGDEGGSTEDRLTDARIARQDGDFNRAVTLLRGALDAEPENIEVRVELAATLLDQNDVNVLDLQQTFQQLDFSGSADRHGDGARRIACSSDATDGYAFDPTGANDPDGYGEVYQAVLVYRPVLDEVFELVRPVFPEEFLSMTLGSIVEHDAEGDVVLSDDPAVYNPQALLAGLEANLQPVFGADTEEAAGVVLAIFATTRALVSYFAVFEDAPAGTQFFGVNPDGVSGYVSACLADASALNAYQGAIQDDVVGLGRAIIALDLRLLLNTPTDELTPQELRDLVNEGAEAFLAVRDGLLGTN